MEWLITNDFPQEEGEALFLREEGPFEEVEEESYIVVVVVVVVVEREMEEGEVCCYSLRVEEHEKASMEMMMEVVVCSC